MSSVVFDGRTTEVRPGETVLDALIRDGQEVPHSCRVGACQSCLMRAVRGPAPAHAQAGLSEPRKAQGYFLACQARPTEDLTVDQGGEGLQRTRVRIAAIERLSETVIRVLLETETAFEYRAGQFVTLIRDDGLSRSYSIASLPGAGRPIELHVRVLAGGLMSRWLAEVARPGDRATIQGPSGDCFYVPGRSEQEMILAGTGTGLAPLLGILQDAAEQGHSAPVTLFHGAQDPSGLYLVEPLRELERRLPWFRYVPCAVGGHGEEHADVAVGGLDVVLLDRVPSFAGRRVFLCGNPALVHALRRKVFLKGAAMKDIASDAFLASTAKAG